MALVKEDVRSANVYAEGPVVCYTLDRTAFTNLVGKMSDADAPEVRCYIKCFKISKNRHSTILDILVFD